MKHTEATKTKLSAMRRGPLNPFYGKKHTPEALARIASATRALAANKQYAISPLRITVPTGERLGYFAGLLDGEGSVNVRRRAAGIYIYNTDLSMLEWLVRTIGGRIGPTPDRRGRQPCYTWNVAAARDVYALLTAALPLLHSKYVDAKETRDHLLATYGERVHG